MQSERESLKRLINPKSKVSCHYLINRGGKIFKIVKDKYVAWHAGKSKWRKYKNLNKNSIGVELVNKGHSYGYQNFSKKQINALIKLSKTLKKKYKIKSNSVLGHSDIAPLRKIDPGEKFPWEKLAKNNLAIWHNLNKKKIKLLRNKKIKTVEKIKFLKNLKIIGYSMNIKNKTLITKAFQRRFRQDLINGKIDEECLLISKNLLKSC